ncbi:MAG: tetratricopeptide repeat protein [Candidatus Aminicenantaceae bacterium]
MRDKSRLFLIHVVIVVLFFGMLSFGQEDLAREEAELFKKYQSLNKDYEKGKMYFVREDYNKAKKEFEKILGKLPEHADAHFFLSQVLYKEGDLAGALSHAEKAKANYEYSARMKIKMAQVSKRKLEEKKQAFEDNIGELEDGIANLPQASEVGDEVEGRKKEIQTKIDKIKKQIENIDIQLNLPPPREEEMPAEYCYLNGNIYFKMKKFQEAHDQYQETIRLDPKHGDAYNNLAALYFQVKQYQKAMEYLNQAEANGAKVNPEFKKAVLKALGKD